VPSIVAAFEPEVTGENEGVITNYAFFEKVYKHLHSKYDNVSGKFYRFPIPLQGLGEGSSLNITQNPGY
jgi:hypothetical protein